MPDRPRREDLADLGLAGDGDEHEMVRDVERTFGVDFGDSFASWITVGDIETAVALRFPSSPTRGRCATAMAFYMLRRKLFSGRKVPPKARLATLGSNSCIGALGELERDLGLRMPRATQSSVGIFGMSLVGLGLIGTIPFTELLRLWWPGPVAVLVGAALIGADRGSFGDATLGDLARNVALLNYGAFAARGADRQPETIWAVLRHVVSRQTAANPDAVTRATRILTPRKSHSRLRGRGSNPKVSASPADRIQ